MEGVMATESNRADWWKELQVLLRKIQSHPTQDCTAERDRIVVLNKLMSKGQGA
jgi:hypothetical protein